MFSFDSKTMTDLTDAIGKLTPLITSVMVVSAAILGPLVLLGGKRRRR